MPGAPWRRYGWSIVLVLTLALLGCSGDDDPNLTGTWTGTLQDNFAGTGTALFTFSQIGTNVDGTWQFTFPNPVNNSGGILSGTAGDPRSPSHCLPRRPSMLVYGYSQLRRRR